MYHTTELHKAEILDLCEMIHREATEDGQVWPPILGLYKSVVVALTYMRRNRVQVELAETYDVSQSTISRAITGITPLLGKLLRKYVPTADELDNQKQYVVDGTLLPCWSGAGHPELYSGKHIAPRRRPVVYPTQSGGIGGIFLGLMPNLAPKGQGDNSMAENQCSCPSVWNEALGDPRDMVKAELLDTPISSGESPAPTGKTPETGAIPCVVVLC
ncbi:MAG: transposase family protein [Chloroflexota bacterium]|nr:transposase family protein [Chloroflexota bacterium]